MTAIINAHQYDVKLTGTSTTVPNSPTARCMYYLKCVCSVLDLDDIPYELTDYHNHTHLSLGDKKKVLVLCALFNIEILDDKVFFQCEELNSSNEFAELGSTQFLAATNQQIVIGGVRRHVLKVMLYKRSWILDYHINALVSLKNEIQREENRLVYQRSLYQKPTYNSAPRQSSESSCCTIL